jgi:hypothetical protein
MVRLIVLGLAFILVTMAVHYLPFIFLEHSWVRQAEAQMRLRYDDRATDPQKPITVSGIGQNITPRGALAVGYLLMLKGEKSGEIGHLKQARTLLEDYTKQAPSDSFGWTYLAAVQMRLWDNPKHILEAWRMSIYTAPNEQRLTLWRADLGVLLFGFLSKHDKQLWQQQLNIACEQACWRVFRLAAKYERVELLEGLPTDKAKAVSAYRFFVQQKSKGKR